jgi:hypothetical protein
MFRSIRLSVRTLAFHAGKRGSIPLSSTKFGSLMIKLSGEEKDRGLTQLSFYS